LLRSSQWQIGDLRRVGLRQYTVKGSILDAMHFECESECPLLVRCTYESTAKRDFYHRDHRVHGELIMKNSVLSVFSACTVRRHTFGEFFQWTQ
jgi:hypothetical protein